MGIGRTIERVICEWYVGIVACSYQPIRAGIWVMGGLQEEKDMHRERVIDAP
jgi:hypothetical protein